MPWMGPLSRLARGRDVGRGGVFLAGTRFLLVERAPGDLDEVVAAPFLLVAFLVEVLLLEAFLFEAFLLVAFLRLLFLPVALAGADFLAVVFVLNFFFPFFFPGEFFPGAFFLAAGLFFDDFFDTFFETFFAVFFREAAFLPFVAAAFFGVALRFPDADLRVAAFRVAAFLPAALAFFRFLLAVVLEGIFYSCRTEKRRGLYMA